MKKMHFNVQNYSQLLLNRFFFKLLSMPFDTFIKVTSAMILGSRGDRQLS